MERDEYFLEKIYKHLLQFAKQTLLLTAEALHAVRAKFEHTCTIEISIHV